MVSIISLKCYSWIWVCLFISIITPAASLSCTSFCLKSKTGPIVGANFDWPISKGLIVINKRKFKKTAITDPSKRHNPISWTSQYGSITFNMYGIEWPWCGINETGLVITSLELKQTQYPLPDNRPSIHMGQWLQYQLDSCSTVDELIQISKNIRIRPIKGDNGIHYFICDKNGNTAIIEYIRGQFTYYTGDSMPIKVLTNEPYALSLSISDNFEGFGGKIPIPDSNLSYCRFMKAAVMVHNKCAVNSKSAIGHAFKTLQKASYKNHPHILTQWTIVFDIDAGQITFKTLDNPHIRSIDLREFDFSCTSPPMVADIHSAAGIYSTKEFIMYDYNLNRERFASIFKILPLNIRSSEKKLQRLARYPETLICSESNAN